VARYYHFNIAVTNAGNGKGGLEMDAKGLEFLNFSPSVVTNIRLSQKTGPVIKPVEGIKRASQDGTASDARKQENKGMITWLQPAQSEENAQLATEILADSLSDTPELEVNWRYDREKRVLIVEVKNRNTGEVVRQMPPEDILNAWKNIDGEEGGALLNRVA
jgi:uncharacterized FlaG/YvyC family protein